MPSKKQKASKSPSPTLEEREPLSQQLVRNICSQVNSTLTQSSDCINNLRNDSLVTIITNPVTSSQYAQLNRDQDEFTDDTLNRLIINDEGDGNEKKIIARTPVKDQSYSSALHGDTEIFENIDEELLRNVETSVDTAKKLNESKPKSIAKPSYVHKFLPVSTISYRVLGSFFGLTKHHKEFIFRTKKIQSLYDWQEECLKLRAIHERSNLIYALPTSGGKTLVAEIAMFREVLLRRKNVIFVLPYVSIVQEKIQDMIPFAVEFKFLVEEYCAGSGAIPPVKRRKKNVIYICTIEKSQILFDSLYEDGRLNEIGLIVVDELHMVGDAQRGYCLEMLLAKAIFQSQARIQIIGMSATISNLQEIAKFLKADVYTRDFRPVELKEYFKIGSELLLIDSKARLLSDVLKVERNDIGSDYKPEILKQDPDHLGSLILEVIPKLSCLVFCATKQNCENVAILLANVVPRELRNYKREEKESLIECIKLDSNGRICRVLAKTIPYGIAYHHSGLTNDERKHIEEAYRLGILCVICCTSTLAAGVNLPAKRVIIRSPYVGTQFLTLTRYKQMVGRAGRAGKCESGESILICDPKDTQKVVDLLFSKMDETISAFVQDQSGVLLRRIVLNLLGTKIAQSIDNLVDFFKLSLLGVQDYQVGTSLRAMVVKSVKELMSEGALTHTTNTDGSRYESFSIMIGGEQQIIYPDDNLQVSMLGKAAVNAGMSLEEAQKVEADLKKAHVNFVLDKYFHMMFIVAPDENVDSINPDYTHFNSILMRLDGSRMHTAKTVGISESLAMRMITNPGSIKGREKELLKRFYVALILSELWNSKDIYQVAVEYKVSRGIVYGLMNSASSKAYGIFKFCEMYPDFSPFKALLEDFSKRLQYCCCAAELLPLMELPAVKIVSDFLRPSQIRIKTTFNIFQGRAKLLYAAGFKTIESIAASIPDDLVLVVKNVNRKQAEQIIKGAKHVMTSKMDSMHDQLEEMKEVMKASKARANQSASAR